MFYRRLLILLLIAMGIYLVGNGQVPLFDRDEGWYAQISREMHNSGDWAVPRFIGSVFNGKPVFAFWCQALSMTFLGDTPFAARLPSAIAAVALLGILGIAIGRGIGYRRALWTVAILASAALMIALSKMCLTDSILLLWIACSQLCLYAIYVQRAGLRIVVLFWLLVGLAILTKGPVVIGVLAGTLLALAAMDVGKSWRSPSAWWRAIGWWRRTHPWLALPIIAAVIGPWIYLVQQRSPGFLGKTWQQNMFGPIVNAPLEGHNAPPGYYLLAIWIMWMPWSLFLPLTITSGWKNRRLKPIRFALASVIGPWLIIEVVRQKLPHYLLPLFPALAFLTADMLVRYIRAHRVNLPRPANLVATKFWAAAVVLVGLLPFAAAWPFLQFDQLPWAGMTVLACLCLGYAVLVYQLFRANRPAAAGWVMAGGMGLAVLLLFGVILPRCEFLQLSSRAASVLKAHGATSDRDVTMLGDKSGGYHEPSLAFYQGAIRDRGNVNFLTESHPNKWPRWVVTTSNVRDHLPADRRARWKTLATLHGWAAGGSNKIVDVVVLEKIDVPASHAAPTTSATSASSVALDE